MKDFDSMESSIAGDKTEEMVINYWIEVEGADLIERSKGYVKERDAILSIDGEEIDIEVKLDNFMDKHPGSPFRPVDFIPVEFKQHNMHGKMVRSGIDVCKAKYFCVFCRRQNLLYIFQTEDLKNLIKMNRFEKTQICNLKEEGNNTECYMIDSGILQTQYRIYGSNEDTYKIVDMTTYLSNKQGWI